MNDLEWRKLGRASAWADGGLAIVGGVLVTIVSVGIPPTEPDPAKHYVQRSMPRGLSWVSVGMAGVFAVGLASLVSRDLGVPLPDSVGSLVIALGALLALVWAAWLGWALGRLPAQPRASST